MLFLFTKNISYTACGSNCNKCVNSSVCIKCKSDHYKEVDSNDCTREYLISTCMLGSGHINLTGDNNNKTYIYIA